RDEPGRSPMSRRAVQSWRRNLMSARLHGPAAAPLVFVTLLSAFGMAQPAAAVDVSGDYVGFNLVPFTVRVTQEGTALEMSGHVVYQGMPYAFSARGTVDPSTGAVSVTGEIETICTDIAFTGTGDSEELKGNAIAHCVTGTQQGPFQLTKCGNGVI